MKEQDLDAKMSRRPIERYQWPLSGGLLLLAASMLIGERKRAARREARLAKALAAAATMALLVSSAHAGVWKNPGVELYQRGVKPSEKGMELLKNKDAEGANREFDAARKEFEGAYNAFSEQLKRQPDSPALNFNRGAAAYKLGKDDEALLAFSKATLTDDPQLRVSAESNLANTLYQKGRKKKDTDKQATLRDWKDGLKHYDDALKVQPDNKLVQGYREFLRRQIEELEKEPPKSDDKKDQDKKDEPKKDNKNEDQKQPKDGEKKSDQKQNPQDQQKQDQKQDQQKNQQDQKSPGDQPQDQKQPKDGSEKSDEQGEQDKKDGQQQKGDKGDQKDAKDDPKNDGQNPQNQGQAKNAAPNKDGEKGEQPKPSPDQPDKKLAGDIKPGNEQPAQPDPQQQAAEEAQAALDGRMTEAQAKGLLDSLKGEDQRVHLLKPGEGKPGGRVLKDW